jgi:hypothetical protein
VRSDNRSAESTHVACPANNRLAGAESVSNQLSNDERQQRATAADEAGHWTMDTRKFYGPT